MEGMGPFILMRSSVMERWLTWRDLIAHLGEEGDARVRYDEVFLDVDGTLLWVKVDVEGYGRSPRADSEP